MFDKEKRAEKQADRQQRAAERVEASEVTALAKLEQRRNWIVLKMAAQVSLTGPAFNNELSNLAQELHYLESAAASLRSTAGP